MAPLYFRLLIFLKLFSEIGFGWAPAMINSSLELDFIEGQHRRLSNHMNFWIGGSTSAFNESKIKITEYIRYPACRGDQPNYIQLLYSIQF